MPIYEFACPSCRRVFSFLSKRVNPAHSPTCPKCGQRNLTKEISRFAMIRSSPSPNASPDSPPTPDSDPNSPDSLPNFDDARVVRAMNEMERDMQHLDEQNPKHMAHMMKKLKDIMPAGAIPKDIDVAIKRLEAGEDPDKIEADMGDVLGCLDDEGSSGNSSRSPYTRDSGLYDY